MRGANLNRLAGVLFLCQCSITLAIFISNNVNEIPIQRTTKPSFVSQTSRGNIETIELTLTDQQFILNEWRTTFPNGHSLYMYDSHTHPQQTHDVINDAFCFCTPLLPPGLVAKLSKFPFDPKAPCAMIIRGIPINPTSIPPTPALGTIFAKAGSGRTAICPMAETFLLGISRLLGMPHSSTLPANGHMVRDIVPTSATETDPLPMHRDFPSTTKDGWEPELLVLLCVRSGSEECQASTIVTDTQRLFQKTSKADRALLSQHKIQIQFPGGPDGALIDIGAPFLAMESGIGGGADDDSYPSINLFNSLFNAPGSIATSENAQALKAHERLSALAMKLGERATLQPGDMLILNNARCVHGRTAYQPKLDETDRWLIKTYVSNGMWNKPGSRNRAGAGPSTFPDWDFPAAQQ
jgi:L-asparagine oxygenase